MEKAEEKFQLPQGSKGLWLILLQEETAEVNNYGELVTHLADLIEDYELEEEQEREQIEG